MHRLITLASICAVAALAGCGNHVDHDSAVKVMNSALTGTVTADGKVVDAQWTDGHVDVTVTDGSGKGTAHVVGSLTKDNNGVINTQLDVTFDHWTNAFDNVTLDGSLHEQGSFSSTAPMAGQVSLTGALQASGAVNATVDFDLKGMYSSSGFSISGDVGGNVINGSFSVSGH